VNPSRLPATARPLPAQQPVDGGGAHLQEQPPVVGGHLQLTMPLQGRQQAGDRRCQQLAAHPVAHLPRLAQRLCRFRAVFALPWSTAQALGMQDE